MTSLSEKKILKLFRKKHNINVMVDKTLSDSITKYFDIPEESQLPILEHVYCPHSVELIKKNMIKYTNKDSSVMEDDFLKLSSQGIVVHMWPEASTDEEGTFWLPENLMTEYGQFMRRQLRFKPEYSKFSQKTLRQIAKRDKSGNEIVFIGVHVRRTDYIKYSKNVLKKKIAGKSHFLAGIEYYQSEYPDESVYFITVSDDMAWVRKHLGGVSGVVLAGMADEGRLQKKFKNKKSF